MSAWRSITSVLLRNLIGFAAISLVIILITFLPLAIKVTPHATTPDLMTTNWSFYFKSVGSFLVNLTHGDFGELRIKMNWIRGFMTPELNKQILSFVAGMASRSASILMSAVALGTLSGILLGAVQFFVPTWARKLIGGFNHVIFSMPDLLLILLLSLGVVKFNQLLGKYLIGVADFGENKIFALPMLSLLIPVSALVYRYTVNACYEAYSQECVRTARAKGLPEHHVFRKYVMRPALDSILAVLPKVVAFAASSLVIVERFLNIQGVTWWFQARANIPELTKLLATILMCLAAFVVVVNLIASLLRLWVNPALRK
ncbi:ABC transporter permease subunit [Tumebacillus permanentifrigoris]|uniref:ABC-type dipeptide/oligopeptide/nickel transport system permease component n=1 Tax=Tumebacillus permanentifrigoris TaxID=378543 RepID=A0A316D648_9BACL|nr:ABC transporter permease subunit [Tumebacillus permanentifrigoris]PWK09584.1 ABC-type dipeptide/oligopeptide/nickel transport system permease component [Tumebacillus permanentifrigoris]